MDPSPPSPDLPVGSSLVDLPTNLIDSILLLLPIRDAVRSSAISRVFRHRWQSLPSLSLHSEPSTNPSRSPLSSSAIDHVLLLHSSPLHSLSLCCTYASSNADRWFLSLSLPHRSLPLSLKSLSLYFLDRHLRFHPVHSSIYSYVSLASLSLTHCQISPPPSFSSFPSLASLSLRDVQVRSDGQLQTLLSKCPALESLLLLYVRPSRGLRIPHPTLDDDSDDDLADRFRSAVCTGLVCLHDVVVSQVVHFLL